MSASQLLADKRGLVLGVSSRDSVGFHTAEELRSHGADVNVTLRPSSSGFMAELADAGYAPLELDALAEGSVQRAVRQVGERFGRLDFLVHTLVHVPDGALGRPLTALSAREFADAMEVGVRSLLVAAEHARPWLEKSSSPRIVALLSGGADFAMPNYHVVGMVKAALSAAIRYLARHDSGPTGVRRRHPGDRVFGQPAVQQPDRRSVAGRWRILQELLLKQPTTTRRKR